jgi:hypothetical protein
MEIQELIPILNEQKILCHGIKRPEYLNDIEAEGIRPLTPEGGPASYWSTGKAVFYPTLYSTFYYYSGFSTRKDLTELNMALTKYGLLGLKEPFKKDSHIMIRQTVPRELICLINVKVKHPAGHGHEELRKYCIIAEGLLLEGIIQQAEGFLPGGNMFYFKLLD